MTGRMGQLLDQAFYYIIKPIYESAVMITVKAQSRKYMKESEEAYVRAIETGGF